MGLFDKILGKEEEHNKPLVVNNGSGKKDVQDKVFEENFDKHLRELEKKEQPSAVPVEKKTSTTNTFVARSINRPASPPISIYKPLVDKKLTIILIEDTTDVVKAKDTLIKIVKKFTSAGLVRIINYGDSINQSEILEIASSVEIDLFSDSNTSNNVCLYDALVELNKTFVKEYMSITEKEKQRVRINEVEIIGIGTCKDTCSKISKEIAIKSFSIIANKPHVTTKYFCLTEESFINAAEIGFRSIGAISIKY